jgi:hypothetical protein
MERLNNVLLISTISFLTFISCSSIKQPKIISASNANLDALFSSLKVEKIEILDFEKYKHAILLEARVLENNEHIYLISPREYYYDKIKITPPNYYNQADSIYRGLIFKAILTPRDYVEKGNRLKIFYGGKKIKTIRKTDRLKLYDLNDSFELMYYPM